MPQKENKEKGGIKYTQRGARNILKIEKKKINDFKKNFFRKHNNFFVYCHWVWS